jgi:transposase InsO family protein
MTKIDVAQSNDKELLKTVSTNSTYTLKTFRGGGKTHSLIVHNDKIVIPKSLQVRAVEWYHWYLCHPGETRTEQTIRQHFWWNNLRTTVHTVCKTCDKCQRTKKTHKKYGHLPEKQAEVEPWEILCIDLIGPYTINRKNKRKKPLTLWALTMIDPATGWFEMREIKTKSADNIANVLEVAWLARYPWPSKVIFDRGSEFKAEVNTMITRDYGVRSKPTSVRNPQANAIVERVHQTIGNMIRTFEVYDNDSLDDEDPWTGILSAVMAAVRSTYSTTTQATPSQLVFGRDAILNIPYVADWDYISKRKQQVIHDNNVRENARRVLHAYHVGDKVLQRAAQHTKYGGPEYEGPYVVTAINGNGTITIRKKAFHDTVNIRQIKPYHES